MIVAAESLLITGEVKDIVDEYENTKQRKHENTLHGNLFHVTKYKYSFYKESSSCVIFHLVMFLLLLVALRAETIVQDEAIVATMKREREEEK